jgi:HSP20 family protein
MANETSIDKRESQEVQQAERMRPGRTYIPNVDIIEREDKLLLVADMPGVKPDDLDIRYERGELTIHGKVQPRAGAEQQSYLLREYGVGDYYRAFQIGKGIDSSKIEAELKDGVLTLQLPKTEAAVPRRIAVKS